MRHAARERLRADVIRLSKAIGPRPAGTEQNGKALEVARERFESLGLDVRVERFPFRRFEATEWRLAVAGLQVLSVPCLLSPSTDRTIQGRLSYVGYGTTGEIRNVSGRIVLAKIGRVHESVKAERAAKRGAVGAIFFAIGGENGIYTGRLRYPVGSIPAVCVSSNDGLRLSKRAAHGQVVEMQVKAKSLESTGRNLCAETEGPDWGYVTLTAHRDSRPFSPGANDNASGTALMMDVASRLAQKHLRRRVLFLSTDAEEYGLLGSRHHVRMRGETLRKCVANLNLDSVGQGRLHVIRKDRHGQLSPTLNGFVAEVACELGQRMRNIDIQNGSDCDAFAEAGVDSGWIRGWPSNSFNSTTDSFEKLDYGLMKSASGLVTRVVEGLSLPDRWKATSRDEGC